MDYIAEELRKTLPNIPIVRVDEKRIDIDWHWANDYDDDNHGCFLQLDTSIRIYEVATRDVVPESENIYTGEHILDVGIPFRIYYYDIHDGNIYSKKQQNECEFLFSPFNPHDEKSFNNFLTSAVPVLASEIRKMAYGLLEYNS